MGTITSRLAQIQHGVNGKRATTLSSGAYFDSQYENTHTARTTSDEHSSAWNIQRVTSAQNRRIRHEQPNKITVYADMIKVSMPEAINGVRDRDRSNAGGGIRGDVVGFSRASRKRMLEFMAKVRDQGDMYFVTMTYDDDSWLFKHDDHHADFEAFRRRFERAFPNWKAIWRVEVKERKSGKLLDSRVPHFHLLVFTGRNDDDETKEANAVGLQAWGISAWGNILQAENPHFEKYGFHCTVVRSRKHAYSYVSKYIGKCDEDDISCGRRWGRIGKFDCSYSETITLTDDEAVYFKRLVKRWLRNRNKGYASRFSKQAKSQGYTVFGIGDTGSDGVMHGLFGGYNQFIVEVTRWSAEKGQRERGVGD